MSSPKKTRKKIIAKAEVKETNLDYDNFEKFVKEEAERTGQNPQKIIDETFKDGFLIWTVNDTAAIAGEGKPANSTTISQSKLDSMIASIQANKNLSQDDKTIAVSHIMETYKVGESATAGGITQATPVLTAWAMPQDANDVDEHRRLRKEFAPVSRAIDYLKSTIMGNNLDVLIDDPADKYKLDLKEQLQDFMRDIYQDQYTTSLYSLLGIMLDEALTVGGAGAEIRYNVDPDHYPKFWDYVKSVKQSPLPVGKGPLGGTSGSGYTYFESKEPEWKKLNEIVQLKLLKNGIGRLKLYRDPRTWEANYWTLDEIVGSGDTAMAIHQLTLKDDSGQVLRYYPWQMFWLNLNRREYDERGISVIEPVKKTALLLEKILSSVGEGIYRAGNKKYFIICGTEKRPWSKPHIRNVMQQIQEMGKRNWTNVPVPYGFDIKDIGGTVFEAESVIANLTQILAQGMHVPLSVVIPAREAPESAKEQSGASFNEIERMRHEFKQAVEQQLFKKQLWCKYGKTRQKQGGAVVPMYVPELEQSTKGLQSPIERLTTIVQILNVANPVDPQLKLELDREFAKILGYDMIKMKTQEALRKELDVMQNQKEEQAELALKQTKLGIENAKKAAQQSQPTTNPIGKQQGQPQPPTEDKQQKRLASGVSKNLKGKAKPMGGPRTPKENKGIKETAVDETEEEETTEVQDTAIQPILLNNWDMDGEDFEHRQRRVQMYKNDKMNHQQISETFLKEANDLIIQEFDTLKQEPAAHPQHIVPSSEYKSESSQKTGGNYGPQGYHTVVIGKGTMRKFSIKKGEGEFITAFINPLTQEEVEVVKTQLSDGIAGFSEDMSKIYIDEAVPNWMYLGLITHETFEMTMMKTLGFEYKFAHIKATEVEKEAVENLGIDWKKYDDEYKRLLKVVEERKPHPSNPKDIEKSSWRKVAGGKGGGMDSPRLGHTAQEDTGKPLMGRTELQYSKDNP
jgi:hypothetical protein